MIAGLSIQSPGGPQQVRIEFAQTGDDAGLRKWKAPAKHSRPDLARDSIELVKLAGKRWRYYLRRNEAATSMDDLLKKLAAQPTGEVGFILIAKSVGEKTPSTLGIAVVAERLGCQLVWGEATETSCAFCQKLPGGTPVLDHFFFGSETLARLRRQLPSPNHHHRDPTDEKIHRF